MGHSTMDGTESRWEELRKALAEHARTTADGTWWDEAEIRDAVMEANARGVDVDLAFQCREACRSHVDFIKGLHDLIERIPGRKARVLMVDDEESFLRLAKMNLERTRRYEVGAVSDPESALDMARDFDPDIILMDVVMPGKDGLDLVQELKSDESLREIPVIMLTALASGLDHGAVAKDGVLFLSKPVEMKELVHCIQEHLKASAGTMKVASRDGGGDQ
ncbi:MAG: response regulator [Verrucomicrobiota bacterium]